MPPEEEKIATHALKRKLESSFDGQTAVFKTRGQSLYIKKVTKPRVPSDKASHSRRKIKARETVCCQTETAGRSIGASRAWQIDDLRKLPKKKKESICAAACVRNRVVVSKKTGLVLKTALGLSWYKYVRQKRILASLGVKFDSEKKERDLKHTL